VGVVLSSKYRTIVPKNNNRMGRVALLTGQIKQARDEEISPT
jgi:hypothetical protein